MLPPGTVARFKWYCRPGDIKFSAAFYSGGPPPPALVAAAGVSQPEPGMRYCLPPSEVTELSALRSLQGTDVARLQAYPHSDKEPVVVTHVVPPQGGFFVLTWDNRAGWRQRELFHRCVRPISMLLRQ